jgi:quercetin dioxygenase-like cupin family protein
MTTEQTPEYLKTHTLKGALLAHDLAAEVESLRAGLGEKKHAGVTLAKESGVSVVLVALRAGGSLDPHQAAGPVTIHVLDGRVRVTAGESQVEAAKRTLITVGAGVRHAVEAIDESAVLVTIAQGD